MIDAPIEAALRRAGQLAERVLGVGCSESDHALVDHECPIDMAVDMLAAISECRKGQRRWGKLIEGSVTKAEELKAQLEWALGRIDDGRYGLEALLIELEEVRESLEKESPGALRGILYESQQYKMVEEALVELNDVLCGSLNYDTPEIDFNW